MTPAEVLPFALRNALSESDTGRVALKNLESETRLGDADIEDFRVAVAGATRLEDLAAATYGSLRRIPCTDRAEVTARADPWYNHQTLAALQRAGAVDADPDPVGEVSIGVEFAHFASGAPRPLWITPEAPATADDVAELLGLAFYDEGDIVLRLAVPVGSPEVALFIPSALDAQAAWYWRRPDVTFPYPWGLTRRASDCAPGAPELLAVIPPRVHRAAVVGECTARLRTGCMDAAR